MARYCPLFSSSKGNATYLSSSKKGGILVDAGVSAKRLKTALLDRNIDPASLQAIFLTHEHTDHVCGLKVFLKQYPLAVYATKGTLQAMIEKGYVDETADLRAVDGETVVGDLKIEPFATPHDSRESCGYRITFADERTAAIATDIGFVSDVVKDAATGCDLVHIESNHDVRMLECGSYPYTLKCRILGRTGHLSNEHCARFLQDLVACGSTRFVLSHLSPENNLPQLAWQTSLAALSAVGAQHQRDYLLSVAPEANDGGVTIF